MKNRVLRYLGYVLFIVLLFLLFVYVRFPYAKIKERIITSFERNSSYEMTIKDLRPLFPIGLDLRDAEISKELKNKKTPVFHASRFAAKVQIIPLFTGKLSFKYMMETYGGTVRGTAKISHGTKSRKASITADIRDISLGDYSFLERDLNFSFSGKLKGTFKVVVGDFNMPQLKGEANLRVDGGEIRGINMKGMVIKKIPFDRIDCTFELVKDKIVLENLSLRGEDMDFHVAGTISTGNDKGESALNLRLRFKPRKGFERKYRLIFALFKNLKDKKGYFTIPVTGTLKNPEITASFNPS